MCDIRRAGEWHPALADLPAQPEAPPRPVFPRCHIIGISAGAILLFLSITFGVRLLRGRVEFDAPRYWPISEVAPHLPAWHALAIGAAALLALNLALPALYARRYPLPAVLALGFALTFVTTFMQADSGGHGPWAGFIRPVCGGPPDIQYYHDAVSVSDAVEFIKDFEARQPHLLDHARTHPPGAVLVYVGLLKITRNPLVLSVVLAAVSILLSGIALHRILRAEQTFAAAGLTTLLFLLLPATQVYYLSSLDALIAGLVAACLASAAGGRGAMRMALSSACLFAASALTFAALFLPAVLLAWEWLRDRTVRRGLVIVAGAAFGWLLVGVALDYDYVNSLRIAAAIENPAGFRLFAQPLSYVMTRLECLGDVAVFIGPFVLVLVARGLRRRPAGVHRFLAESALVVFVVMLLTGAFHTGETARAALFLVPMLMVPVATALGRDTSARDARVLANLVFGQAVLMQALGDYFW